MKKIQILTFARGDNYGAVLQSYGLAETLRRMGYTVEFISLKKRATWRYRIISTLSPLKYRFESFRKKFLRDFTKPAISAEELKEVTKGADCCIVGSDQVWNPAITSVRTPFYFFNFLPDNKPRISYAASFGTDSWKFPEIVPEVKTYLDKFSAISVREKIGIEICKEVFGISATQVLDPTLLLGDFKSLLKRPKYKDSIVGFNFNPSSDYYLLLKKIGHKTNSKILVMDLPSRKMGKEMLGFKLSPFTSVENWVTNIANAKIVITDSFHCMAFSILFHKEFYYIAKNKKLVSRITSLLNLLGIEGRIFQTTEELNSLIDSSDFDQVPLIDYSLVDSKLEKLRNESKQFLINSLANI